jgi:hypothetical protein
MANDPKTAGRAVATQAAGPTAGPSVDAQIETALNGVQGKVRQAIVSKLRALVDKDPAAFVRHMRAWMGEGRSDTD